MSNSKKGSVPWNKGKTNIYSFNTLNKIRKYRLGKRCSKKTRMKMRMSHLKYIETVCGRVYPNFNPTACQKIDEYGKRHGYHFQHAKNGGEFHIKGLGYFVDGYDAKKNVVIEYYERAHQKTKEQDENRKREIINHLGCKFIELKEWKNVE